MSEEDINNLKEMLVDFNEYSTDYTKTRCKELEKTVENTLNEINRLNNIIDELEKWLEERTYGMNEIHTYKIGALEDEVILNKLKALKENNK